MTCAIDLQSRRCCDGTATASTSSAISPGLTTYLGHAHVSDTYWYLTLTPELMQLAARRLDRVARRPLS